jgi:hypothetical protein
MLGLGRDKSCDSSTFDLVQIGYLRSLRRTIREHFELEAAQLFRVARARQRLNRLLSVGCLLPLRAQKRSGVALRVC